MDFKKLGIMNSSICNNALHDFTLIKMTVASFLNTQSFLIENFNGHTN